MGDSSTCSNATKIKFKSPYLREHTPAPSSYCGKKSWSQIPGRVNSVSAVVSESGANNEHDQTNHDGYWALVRSIVTLIDNGEDAANQQGCAKHLRNTWTHTSHAMLPPLPWNTTRLSVYARLSVCQSVGLPASCLPAGLSVCLSACLPVCLTAWLPEFLSAWLPDCLTSCLPVCLTAWLPDCLTAWLPDCLTAWLPDGLSACLPICPSARLPVCPSASLPVSLSLCLSTLLSAYLSSARLVNLPNSFVFTYYVL